MARPELRFPEFTDEWEEVRLKEISSLITKGTTPSSFSDNSEIKFIKIESLNGINIDNEKCLYISKKIHNKELKRSILKKNDILFAIAGATVGKCAVIKENNLPANTNQALAIIRLKDKQCFRFVLSVLESVRMKRYINICLSVGAQPNLSLKQISDFTFFLPHYIEQQKIADFLSSVNAMIQIQEEQILVLEEQKKSVMQKIFNREVRFKTDDGSEYPEWKKTKLNQQALFLQGLTYSPEDVADSGTLVLRSSNIQDNRIVYEDNVYVNMDIPISLRVKEDDILMCARNGSRRLVGKTALITKRDLKHTWGAFMMIIRSNENNKFIYYYLNSELYNKQMFKDSGTSTIGQITKSMLNDCDLFVPCIEEQQRISNCLSGFDEMIQIKKEKLEIWRKIKKGLLQRMFI